MTSRTVRTTIRPDESVEVDEAEYTDLARMGLLVEDKPGLPAGAVRTPRVANPTRIET